MKISQPTLFSSILLILFSVALRAQYAPRLNFGAKFELPDKVIHGMGQNEELSISQYTAALPPAYFPRLFMSYVPSQASPERLQRTRRELKDIVRYYPDSLAFQIGVSMTSNGNDYAQEIIDGVYDDNIDALAAMLDSLDRNVFVRIGYEANGFWNGYNPTTYVPAFQRVADRMRAVSDRFAIVWCTHPVDGLNRMLQFYPGDDYVDWWSIDLFQPHFMTNQATQDFLVEATQRGFPVMIGESTPTQIGVGNGQQSWDDWYAVYFGLIRDNPVIKAFCYINRDWREISSWPNWGNANIQTDPVVLDLYREEMTSALYAHLPQTTGHRTAMVRASDELELASNGEVDNDEQTFTVGFRASDTLMTYIRFDLDTLMEDSIRAVKFWVAGRGNLAQDRNIEVVQVEDWGDGSPDFAGRPAIIRSLGISAVNDNGRDKLVWVELTEAVREIQEAGEQTVALSFRLTEESSPLNTFHSGQRTDGYPPQLQVVYDETTPPVSVSPFGATTIDVSLSPNPTADSFLITTNATNYTLRVYDLRGRLMTERRALSGPVRCSTTAWPAGTYLVEAVTRDGRRGTRQLVVSGE